MPLGAGQQASYQNSHNAYGCNKTDGQAAHHEPNEVTLEVQQVAQGAKQDPVPCSFVPFAQIGHAYLSSRGIIRGHSFGASHQSDSFGRSITASIRVVYGDN